MRIRPAIALLSASLAVSAAAPRTPAREEQARVLEAARQAALDYTKALPDFICTEIISRSSDASGKGKAWSAVDDLMVLLTYFGRQEHYRLAQMNNMPAGGSEGSLPRGRSSGGVGPR